MIANITKVTIGATAAALAIPAMLFLGAGTGHAAPDIAVWPASAPGGVDVVVQSEGLSGWCTYTSTVQGNPIGKPAPALGVPFYLPSEGWHSARLWFPSFPTGSTWNTTVSCPNGVASTQTVW
mgnify:CR=1 FL=1